MRKKDSLKELLGITLTILGTFSSMCIFINPFNIRIFIIGIIGIIVLIIGVVLTIKYRKYFKEWVDGF